LVNVLSETAILTSEGSALQFLAIWKTRPQRYYKLRLWKIG